ncbi:MAG: hypothetical protein AAGB19_13745 [Cyanobacteria bacterium P01_F01_bin.3]
MQATKILKKSLKADKPMDRATICIDFGNGQVKALVKTNGTKFQEISFPSFVASPTTASSDCIQFEEGDAIKTYLVGERAASIPGSNTGAHEHGKSQNSKPLLIHALRMAFGDGCQAVHADVIFTSPSNKVYGSEISQKLQGVTPVTIPADAEVIGSQPQQFTVVVHRAVPQLEGHYAFSQLNLKGDSWIVDVGNRTLITTLVSPAGRILKRRYFGGAGVLGLAERVTQSEALAAHIAEPTPQRVIDMLFSSGAGKYAVDIAADVAAAIADPLAFMADDCSRFLIGGGATAPGLAKALSAKKVKSPQWVNIQALAAVSSQILEG